MKAEDILIYRPVWTCGRYNGQHQVAIFYNLLSGYNYLFENESAQIIGDILSYAENIPISIKDLSERHCIDMDCIISFADSLGTLGLLTLSPATPEDISRYRQQVSLSRKGQSIKDRPLKEKLPFAVTSAEMAYAEKAGGVTSVMLELTYRCSERCIHCYNIGAARNGEEKSGRALPDELTLEDYRRVIDELYDEGLTKVCLSGGDPFSKPIVWEIIEYAHSKGVALDVYTNGQMIADDVRRLADYYPRTVELSLYSGIEKDHDYITQIKGSWKKTMNVLEQLSDLGVPTNIKCCVMRPNLKSYFTVYDVAEKFGAVPQMEISITDSIEGDKCARRLRLLPEEMEIVLRDSNVKLYVGKEAPNYGGQERNMEDNACGAGNTSYCLTPDGELIPCCAFHLAFGNVRKQTVREILSDSPNKRYWNGLRLKDYEECGVHDYCAYCNLCAGNNFTEHGTPIKAGENNCYLAKIRHNLALKMMEGYDPLHGLSLRGRLSQLPDYDIVELHRVFD